MIEQNFICQAVSPITIPGGILVQGTSYIRLIVNNAPKRGAADKRSPSQAGQAKALSSGVSPSPDLVTRLASENRAGASSQIPTPQEAQEALQRLQKDLPSLGQGVNDLHSKLDRSRILSLLAPLVDS